MDQNEVVASLDGVDLGFDLEVDGATEQNLTGTKEDLPHLSREQYDSMMAQDPQHIMQARIPQEFPFAKEMTGTKEDLPELSREEYEREMQKDPHEICQARIPEEFPFPKPHAVNASLNQINLGFDFEEQDIIQQKESCHYEFHSVITNASGSGSASSPKPVAVNASLNEIDLGFVGEESTTTAEKPFVVNASLNDVDLAYVMEEPAPTSDKAGTKEDSSFLTRDDYNQMMVDDLNNITQARTSDGFPSQGPKETKEDLSHLTPSGFDMAEQRHPEDMEQTKVPDDFTFTVDQSKPADSSGTAQSNLTEHESPIKVSSIQNNADEFDDFDFEMPIKPPQVPLQEKIVDDFDFETPSRPLQESSKPKEPETSTKEDLPDLTPAEYKTINQQDPQQTEQASQIDIFPPVAPQPIPAELPTSVLTPPMNALQAQGLLPPESQGQNISEPVVSEWDNVQEITARFDESEGVDKKTPVVDTTPLVTADEALRHFEKMDLTQYKAQIKTSVTRKGFSAFCYSLFGPPKLSKDLCAERDRAFCIAACPFDNEDSLHFRVLKTIYRRLTGSKFDPQRFGGHWDQIGFQGNDPASDLRGTGFLGLVHLLYLVMDPRIYPLARDIYRLSQHEMQNFPMALMSINMTRLTIQSLREDILNKECNKRRQVIDTMNGFYAACFFHLYTIWKYQHKTIADSGFVIKEVETLAKKNPKALFTALEENLEERRKKAPAGDAVNGDDPLSFQAVCDFDEDD